MDGRILGEFFNGLISLLVILFITTLLGALYFIYSIFFNDENTIKTKELPKVTWELKTKGQSVDTIWIYKFKK